MSYEITDQDKALLALVAKHEAGTYDTIYGGESHPLTQMLVGEVLQFQNSYMRGWDSSAVGKYQMLKAVVEESCRRSGFDPTQVRYTSTVQDIMMLDKIKAQRKYNEWKAGSLSTNPDPEQKEIENSQKFMEYLAAEWASCPVPYDMPAGSSIVSSRHPKRNLLKGQSFYAGDGLNKSHHDPDQFLSALIDIYRGGTGEVETIPTAQGDATIEGRAELPIPTAPVGSDGYRQEGNTPEARARNFGSGGSRVTGNTGNRSALPNNLPAATDVYKYEIIDPLDDRYDFRTGKKVARLLENGTMSVQENAPGSTNTPGGDLGVAGNEGVDPETFTMQQVNDILDSRDASSTQAGRYSDTPGAPTSTNPVTAPTGATGGSGGSGSGGAGDSSASGSIGSADGLSGKLSPIKKIPNPLSTDAKGIPSGLGKSGLGSLKPPATISAPAPATPGLSTQPKLPVNRDEINEETRNRTQTLQATLEDYKININDATTDINRIAAFEPEVYKQELETRLTDLNDEYFALYDRVEELKISNPGSNELAQAERQLFSTNTAKQNIENKIDMGSPYGLTIHSISTRVKGKAEYTQQINKIKTNLNSIDNLKQTAKQEGIDLKGKDYVTNYQTVVPVIKFTNN